MRVLKAREMCKRGCVYCLDYTKKKAKADARKKSHVCMHDECPYHELDNYSSYTQYLKSEASICSLKQALLKVVNAGVPQR